MESFLFQESKDEKNAHKLNQANIQIVNIKLQVK